nr:MAG TPA: hypothetical protein [Caudoviricetes sp.]
MSQNSHPKHYLTPQNHLIRVSLLAVVFWLRY